MARGEALLVGLKSVDPAAYNGWDGEGGCWGCELDVDNIEHILSPLDFSSTAVKTADATAARVLQSLEHAADSLQDGDLFVFYYSGHGGQQPDVSGDEADGHDETLVLYDRQLVDDELNDIWLKFSEGVRIVMISDSCNSGTNYRHARGELLPTPMAPVPDDVQDGMRAQMIHMGGCRDSSTSSGYLSGGAFTIALCNAWAAGASEKTYKHLFDRAVEGVHTGQKPKYNEYGSVADAFRKQRPFTI
jgi:hypothetical protein